MESARTGRLTAGTAATKEWRGDPDAFPEPLVNAPGALAVVIGTPTAPDAPSALGATAVSDSQIDRDWTDASNNEDGFKIETSADGGTTFTEIATVGANETAYSDTGLPASTTRHYRVRAFNAVDNSDYSNTASATTEATPDPGSAPTVSSCSPDNGNQNERLLVQVTGLNFENSATVDFGDGVNVQSVTFVSPTRLDVQIKGAQEGSFGPSQRHCHQPRQPARHRPGVLYR